MLTGPCLCLTHCLFVQSPFVLTGPCLRLWTPAVCLGRPRSCSPFVCWSPFLCGFHSCSLWFHWFFICAHTAFVCTCSGLVGLIWAHLGSFALPSLSFVSVLNIWL